MDQLEDLVYSPLTEAESGTSSVVVHLLQNISFSNTAQVQRTHLYHLEIDHCVDYGTEKEAKAFV